jgi:hypothetical protein
MRAFWSAAVFRRFQEAFWGRRSLFSAARLITLIPCPSQQRFGRTRQGISFRKTALISSQRAPISKLTTFAPRSVSRFCSAVFSPSRATSPGNLKPGLYFRIIITLLLIPKVVSGNASSLSQMLGVLHARTAGWSNRLDKTPRRKVWHNFWDTRLTYQKSYLARLNYVHQNAVKHGLALMANQYRWCSAGWFESVPSPSIVRSIYGFKTDALRVSDDFAPIVD